MSHYQEKSTAPNSFYLTVDTVFFPSNQLSKSGYQQAVKTELSTHRLVYKQKNVLALGHAHIYL
jgi:hypothetical protein